VTDTVSARTLQTMPARALKFLRGVARPPEPLRLSEGVYQHSARFAFRKPTSSS
jgi:hypothetical protein